MEINLSTSGNNKESPLQFCENHTLNILDELVQGTEYYRLYQPSCAVFHQIRKTALLTLSASKN